MAFVHSRTLRDGTVRHRVQWRHGGRQHTRTFTSRDAAERWKVRLELLGHDDALALLAGPAPPASTPTVAQVVRQHIDQLTGVTAGTRRRYVQLLDNHIAPQLGDLPLDLLTAARGAAWVNALEAAGKSGRTIRNVHSLLSAACTTAVQAGTLEANPVKGLRLPRTVAEEMVFLTPAEMGQFVALTPAYWRPLVTLLFTSGLRFGEATALQVQDVDLGNHTIRVRQAWKAGGTRPVLGPPKSARARRTVPVPQAVAADLARLVAGQPPTAFVFTNTQGRPVRHSGFHGHVWQPTAEALERATGKRPRIHDARHSFAAAAIAAGYSLTSLQRHLGHETITTTSDTYGHVMPADRDAYAQLVQLPEGGLALPPGVQQVVNDTGAPERLARPQ